MIQANRNKFALCLALISIVAVIHLNSDVHCAPTNSKSSSSSGSTSNSNSNNKNGGLAGLTRSGGLLSNLFRRQTSNGSSSSSSSSSSADSDEQPMTQTEIDAQKFMDSLPNANANQQGPSSFRERVSDTFGLLREGVSNQFRSLRDNWTDTVEDLRDTWTSSSSE